MNYKGGVNMQSPQWVQDLAMECAAQTPEDMQTLNLKKVVIPKPGDIVIMVSEESEIKYQKVRIEGGQFFDPTYGRVSNWWCWREIDDDGNVANKISAGYGNFYVGGGRKESE